MKIFLRICSLFLSFQAGYFQLFALLPINKVKLNQLLQSDPINFTHMYKYTPTVTAL